MELLDANHNDIEELPDFYGCTAMKELYLANNFITVFVQYYYIYMKILNNIHMIKNLNIDVYIIVSIRKFQFFISSFFAGNY